MSAIRCNSCEELNHSSIAVCRKCGRARSEYTPPSRPVGPRAAAKRSSWLYTVLFIALICAGAHYLYGGFMRSFERVQTTDYNGVRPQAIQSPPALTTRAESDRQRITPFKAAIQTSPGLAQADKRLAETQKLMQQLR